MVKLVIKEVAERQGLNQSQLQIKSGVTPALMNRYWRSKTESVTLEELAKIARALGVRTGDLIADEEAEKAEVNPGT